MIRLLDWRTWWRICWRASLSSLQQQQQNHGLDRAQALFSSFSLSWFLFSARRGSWLCLIVIVALEGDRAFTGLSRLSQTLGLRAGSSD